MSADNPTNKVNKHSQVYRNSPSLYGPNPTLMSQKNNQQLHMSVGDLK